MTVKVYYAFGFLIDRPPATFLDLAERHMGELLRIINNYQNPLKYLGLYPGSIKIHLAFSGIILEQLLNKDVIDACKKIIDIPLMLNEYRESRAIEIIGMGYSNPLFPLIPPQDWDLQIFRGKEILMEVFGREPKGFWCPSEGLCPEIIPLLKKYGYEYIITDKIDSGYWPAIIASDGVEMGVVSIHEYLSKHGAKGRGGNKQEIIVIRPAEEERKHKNILKVKWARIDEVTEAKHNLGIKDEAQADIGVDSETEGEFWEDVWHPLVRQIGESEVEARGVFLRDIIRDSKQRLTICWPSDIQKAGYRPADEFFSDVAQSGYVRNRAREGVFELSRRYHEIKNIFQQRGDRVLHHEYLAGLLQKAQLCLLHSEAGFYLSTDSYWTARLYENLKPGLILLQEIRKRLL